MARKLALIIGNSEYEDAALARLAAPDVDVRALAEVLSTPGIGAFDEVVPLLNEGLATVRRAIARFFDAKHRDDLLFFYFSGHGVRDERGHLYLAVRDTERAILAGTAIEASYVTTRMDRSASKRMVLVLDCCHSGAFGYGAKAAQGATVGTATAFEGTGRGRVVLTATDSTQYAWEGDQVLGEVENSLFTHYMIEGLRTGAADRDEDGLITIDELYDYVYEHVLNDTPKQTPGKWAFGQQGDIVIAHNAAASRTKLPPEIEEAVRNTLPSVRLEAVRELDIILRGRHAGRSNAAREVLKRLAEDDSRRVAAAAAEMLKAFELGGRPGQPETIAREIEIEKKKEVERGETARVEAARVEAARVEAARIEAARVEARRVEAARVEAERVQAERAERAAAVAEQLVAAEAALTRGALDDVRERLDKALEIEPQHAGALKLVATLQQRIEERTRLEEAERRIRELRQKVGALLARANATDSDAEAIALLDEALGLDPEHAEVKELLEERHRLRGEAEAAERRARSTATVQERIARHLERGDLEDAERALVSAEALGAPAEVFAPLRERLAHLHDQRRRDAEEAIRLKAEAEKRARADEIARHLESARKAIGQQRFDEALETLRQASALDAKAPGIAELVSRAEAGKAALETEAKKRQEIDTQLNQASQHLTKGHLTKAIVITDVLLGLDPNHPAAKLLHEQIQKALEGQKEAERKAAQERERQIDDMIATAEAAPTHDTAIEILNDVLRRDPGNAKAGRLLDKRQADLDALKAEQRRSEIAAAQQTNHIALEMVVRRRAKRLERYVARGKAALQQKRYKEALEFAGKGAMLDPDHEAVRGLMDRIHASVEEASRRIDDNVQFTVYRPPAMAPQRWYPLLFFTHLSERRSDALPGEPDPKTQVEIQAGHLLGPAVSSFSRIAQDADVRIPHEALLQINPKIPDVVFNPPEYSFLLLESVHRADFKVRANASLEGRIARGTIDVRMGAIPVAVVTVAIPIDARAPVDEPPVHDVVHPYRRIFASYSHKDQKIVQQFEKYARGIGDSYMRDVIDLRAGEIWNTRLLEMIDSADVFQLFWSTNSMHSPFVRREWEHALTVDKSFFVRPLYWETPFPEAEGLPPPELKRHHFATVAIRDIRDRGPVERHYEPPSSSTEQQADLDALTAEQRRNEIATAQQTIEEHLTRNELDLAGTELDAAEGRFQSTAEFRALRERLQGVRRKEELDRLARAAVEQAQEDFARGNYQRAIADLSKFTPAHDRVSAAIRALKAQAEEIRRVREEQEAQARTEAERAAREERVRRLMAAAQVAVNQQRFPEALEAVEQLRALAPDVVGLDPLANTAADGLNAQRAAEEARRQAETARQEMDTTLARAAKCQRRHDYTAALGLIDEVLARDSQYPAALSLRAEVQHALEEQAANPVAGFSLRSTLSSATVWLRTKALYSNTFRTVTVVLVAILALTLAFARC